MGRLVLLVPPLFFYFHLHCLRKVCLRLLNPCKKYEPRLSLRGSLSSLPLAHSKESTLPEKFNQHHEFGYFTLHLHRRLGLGLCTGCAGRFLPSGWSDLCFFLSKLMWRLHVGLWFRFHRHFRFNRRRRRRNFRFLLWPGLG